VGGPKKVLGKFHYNF